MSRIIGLAGRAGAGKSLAANILRKEFDFGLCRFAGPLKEMLRALGLSHEQVDGDLKETPSPLLGGKTPRQMMQTLGTDWGRNMVSPSLWTDAWRERIKYGSADCVVADDVRFANECETIRSLGGGVILIVRPGAAIAPAHASEALDFTPDYTLHNDGTIGEFEDKVRRVARALMTQKLPLPEAA